ncbi:MAG: phosphoribosylanthranilate isomerase [Limisphaerales bacterium]|jgi:phosphoribosylanthranilate isomerase
MDGSVILKAGAIAHLTDARYFAAYGVDLAGFCFHDGSADYIDPVSAAAVKGWLSGPQFVGEFRDRDSEEMAAMISISTVKIIQVNKPSLQQAVNLPDFEIILEVDGSESDIELSGLSNRVSHLLLDGNALSEEEIKTYLKRVQPILPVLLDYKFTSENIDIIIPEWKPAGLNIRGSSEEQVGLKGFEDLDEVMEKLVYAP